MNKPVLPRDLAAPTYALDYDRPPRHWLWVILLVSAFLGAALLWASTAEIDELSRAEGRVIPSSKTQVIQSAEAGVVAEILVRRGEQVKKGQQLVRLDDTTTTSSAGEVEAKVRALQAQVARQEAENLELQQRNEALKAEVEDLKSGEAAVEERARSELGMVKPGETFYRVIEDGKPPSVPAPAATDAPP